MSERITFTADDDVLQTLDAVEQRDDIDSTAAAVRECITESARLQRECDALQHAHAREVETLTEEIAELEQDLADEQHRADELRSMLKAANRRNDETQALVRYVEGQKQSRLARLKAWFGRD